jgi:hypothetical protein
MDLARRPPDPLVDWVPVEQIEHMDLARRSERHLPEHYLPEHHLH